MSNGALNPTALLATLAECGVDYVLVGAFAVAVHGEVRGTGDVDVMVPAGDEDNSQRLLSALTELDARRLDSERGGIEAVEGDPYPTVMFQTRFGKLDILYRPDGSDAYRKVKQRSLPTTLGGQSVAVVGKSDLIRMKLAAGRPDDLTDVANLTADERGDPREVFVSMRLAPRADTETATEFAGARVAYFDPNHRVWITEDDDNRYMKIQATRAGLTDGQIRQWARSLSDRLQRLEIAADAEIEIEIRAP